MKLTWQTRIEGQGAGQTVRDLALDDDGDLFTDSDLALLSGGEAAKQGVQIRCGFFQGDWFRELDAGIPYWTRILIKRPNLVEVREWFRLAIIATPDITSLTSLNLVYNRDRSLAISYRAVASTGQTINAKGTTS